MFFKYYGPHRILHSFPTRRSSDLYIPAAAAATVAFAFASPAMAAPASVAVEDNEFVAPSVTINQGEAVTWTFNGGGHNVDRKSTRLKSSQANISYAVFCM